MRTTTGVQMLTHRTDKLFSTQASGLTPCTISASTTVSIANCGRADIRTNGVYGLYFVTYFLGPISTTVSIVL